MKLDSGLSLQQEVGWDRATVRAARYLAQCQDQSFLITSSGVAKLQLAKWCDYFPTVWPTVRADCGQELLPTLLTLNLGFTFTSKSELSTLFELGTDLSIATFANSCKMGSHLRAAQACGVTTVYCDSVEELGKIKKFHPSARVIIELGTDSSTGGLASSSGATMQEIPAILAEATKLQLSLTGVALGLTCTGREEELETLMAAMAKARQVVDLAQTHGHILSVLHLGTICHAGTVLSPTYIEAVTAALTSVADMAVEADASHWIVAPSVTLAAKIIAVRTRMQPDLPIQYYINEGVFGAFSSVMAGDTVAAPLPLGGGRRRPGMSLRCMETQIIGPSGDELDIVEGDALLPRMEEGDWLLFPCMGLANIEEFGAVQKVDGSRMGGIRIREKTEGMKGVLPVEMAWAGGRALKTINVDLDLGEGKGEAEGGKEMGDMGELAVGKTCIWEDWSTV